jgi:hypothetical protein
MVSRDADRKTFVDEAISEGIGAPSRLRLKFGTFFFDADLDGRLDVLHANGHIEDDINKTEPSQTYQQSAQLFWNAGPDAAACFVEVATDATGDLSKPIVGRGAAYADIDNDGDLDVLLTQVAGPPMLLRNDVINAQRQANANPDDASAGGATGASRPNWIRIKLIGNGSSSNRSAIGATITLMAGGVTQTRTIMPTKSYLSQTELPGTFGLGQSDRIDSLTVTWPDGTTSEHSSAAINQMTAITQPDPPAGPAPGSPPGT